MNSFSSVHEMIGKIPDSDWLRFAILLLLLLSVLQTIRLLSRVNRSVLALVFTIGMAGLLATWVRNRNEPAFLTPVVDVVAPWLPAKLRA